MKEAIARQLRTKRKELDYTIEEVVEKTKLAPSVVKALESGQWGELNQTYLKGFLKIYCSFLGIPFSSEMLKPSSSLQEDKIEKQLVSQVSAGEDKSAEKEEKTSGQREPTKEYPKTRILKSRFALPSPRVLAVLAGIAVLFLLMRSCSCGNGRTAEDKAAAPTQIKSPSRPAPVKKIAPVPVEKKDVLEVSLTVKNDCFLKVKQEGNVVFEGVLKRGVSETWTAKKELEFKISDGTAVEVEVNGKVLPPLTKIRKPIKSLKITPQGISVDK